MVNPDQSVSFNPSEGDKTPTKPNIENLNNPPLETGKSIDIEKFRELEKKTVFGKDYDKMFEREYEYVKSLPDGPLKKMTEMSIDARNAIKVLSNDPTPQNKADMREYAKIIVAQKLLAIEHACSNGMGVTEKGLEENDARGFLSDALVTKLTDQVIDFSKPDYINQLDDFLTSDKGLDKITAFVKESVENTKKLDIEQKKQLNNKVDIAMDNEHSIDLLKNLSDQLGDLKPNMVSNKPGLDNLKKAIDNAINLRTELGYSTDDLDTKKKIERSEKIKNAYSDIKDAALKYAKVNASGQTVNEKGEPVFNSKLSGVEVGLMFDAGKLSENVIENEVEKQIFLNAQLEKEQRLEEEKIRRQKEADEILANTYKIDITQEKSKLESDFDVINKIRDYGNKTISYRDRIIYVAERFGTTLNSQSNLFYEQPNLLNVFDAQLCVLGANPALFSELEKTIQGGEKMSDRELKTAFVDNMLNDSNYLKRPEMKRFVDEVLRPEFDKNKILLKQNSEGMQDYMHETMKSISVASQTEPYTDMKATLLNDCMDTAKNVIRKSADYRVLAKPFLKNEKLTDQINGAYYYNDLRIRGNDARNKILNNHIPGEQINHNILLDYVAGQVAGAMKEPVKKDSLANNKIPYSNVFEEFGMKNSQYAQGVFKTILSKSNTFNKLCQQNPDKIRDAIVLGDKSFTRVGAQIINEMKDIARVEKDNIIKSYGGTKVKNAPNNDNFGPKTNM